MMADGGMDEFPQKQIILGDVEPDVFAQLARFAYQGLCAVSDGVGSTQIKALINFRCIQCGKRAPREGVYPFCGDACRRALAERMDLYQRGELNKPFMICCTIKNCTSRLLVADKLALLLRVFVTNDLDDKLHGNLPTVHTFAEFQSMLSDTYQREFFVTAWNLYRLKAPNR